MDEIIADLTGREDFPTMRVNFPRSYVDVNREPYELDPRMFAGRLPSFANTRSMRVAGGLGTIPRVVGDGQDIYFERLDVEERAEPDRAAQALSPRAAPPRQQGASGVRCRHSRGLPFDAVGRRFARRAEAARHRDRRSLRHQLRGFAARSRAGHVRATRLFGRAEQALRRWFITESTTAIRPADCIRSARRLNRAIYMDERRRERGPQFAGSPRIFGCWQIGWPPCRSIASGRFRPLPNRKLPLFLSALSVARDHARPDPKRGHLRKQVAQKSREKRPRRAAITRGVTAPQQYATAAHPKQVFSKELAMLSVHN